MWMFFAVLSGFLYTIQSLTTRHVLRSHNDAWAFSFYFSAVGALVSLPFMLLSPKIGFTLSAWTLLIIAGLFIVGQNLLNFSSSKYLEASLQGAITKFRLIWVFLFGIVILHEHGTAAKTIGTILTVIAGLLILQKFKKPQSIQGIVYALAAAILYAIVIVLYKYLFASFNAVSLTFFIFLIPAIVNIVIMPQSISRIRRLYQDRKNAVLYACIAGGFANLAMNQALALGEASRVLVIIEAFLVLTFVGEHIFLKERTHSLIKIIAVSLATVGAILIRL
jgi:drug/metabolite transporter (DMT)-like permease